MTFININWDVYIFKIMHYVFKMKFKVHEKSETRRLLEMDRILVISWFSILQESICFPCQNHFPSVAGPVEKEGEGIKDQNWPKYGVVAPSGRWVNFSQSRLMSVIGICHQMVVKQMVGLSLLCSFSFEAESKPAAETPVLERET